ncbi:hypothetical protein [Desertibacillus haloalkaliphilus]|nr:hypothetical protein [Desertibacillus haloalkaliphilus]
MRRICEVCGRTDEAMEEKLEHDLLDVCENCTGELTSYFNELSES